MSTASIRKRQVIISYIPLLAAILYYTANIVFISPQGNFPLNDDYIYGQAVRHLLNSGQFELAASSPSCFLHIILGAVACKLFGFSYVVLRTVTLAVGLAGTIALYLTVCELGLRRQIAGLIALVYVTNPLFVNLSFTFMTDVASITFCNFYFLFLIRGMRRDSKGAFLAAAIMLLSAAAIRQTAAIYVLCNLCLLPVYWIQRRHFWTILVFLVALPILWTMELEILLEAIHTLGVPHTVYKSQLLLAAAELVRSPFQQLYQLVVKLGQLSCYLGLFCAPLICAFAFNLLDRIGEHIRKAWPWFLLSVVVVGCAIGQLILQQQRLMPFSPILWKIPDLGVCSIVSTANPQWQPWLLAYLTSSAVVLSIVLLTILGIGLWCALSIAIRSLWHYLRMRKEHQPIDPHVARKRLPLFCFLLVIVSLGFLTFQTLVRDYDRYYILVLAPVLICLAITWRWLKVKPTWAMSGLILIAMAIPTTAAQQHYMSWNRARWAALSDLEARGLPADEIDGGYEYNVSRDISLWNYWSYGRNGYKVAIRYRGSSPQNRMRWWPIHGEKHIISFSPLPGYEVASTVPYWSSLLCGRSEMLVLRRKESIGSTMDEQGELH